MLKNYNKLAIISLVLLVCAVSVLVAGFPLLEWLTGKIIHDYDSLKYGRYMNISADFLLLVFFLLFLLSAITGVAGLLKIKKTKEKGQIIAMFSSAISILWLLSSLYAGWGLW